MPETIRELRLVDAAQLVRIRIHVDEALARHGRIEERVAARRHLAQARAHDEEHVGLAHALGEDRVDADAHVADVLRVAIVEKVLEAEGAGSTAARSPR
jgi:hypothetical protein